MWVESIAHDRSRMPTSVLPKREGRCTLQIRYLRERLSPIFREELNASGQLSAEHIGSLLDIASALVSEAVGDTTRGLPPEKWHLDALALGREGTSFNIAFARLCASADGHFGLICDYSSQFFRRFLVQPGPVPKQAVDDFKDILLPRVGKEMVDALLSRMKLPSEQQSLPDQQGT